MGTILVQALAVERSLGTNGHGKKNAEDGWEANHFDVGQKEERDGLVRS